MQPFLLDFDLLILIFDLGSFLVKSVDLLAFVLNLLIESDDFLFKLRKLSFVGVFHVHVLNLELDQSVVLGFEYVDGPFVVVELGCESLDGFLLFKDFLQMKLFFMKQLLLIVHFLRRNRLVVRVEHC